MRNINILLNKGGKWYTTTVHYNNGLCLNTFDLNRYNYYNLALGNEGAYPLFPNGLTKFAKKII